ncbi:MAG: glycosyl transferase group 1 family protein [Candidatus Brocadiaceae bacterium]|nr:glycosyl transferase group 1 family protein [Candidatus Brocadiaceae bacterium]
MKILYDHQIFVYQEFGGISRYFYELMNGFEKDEDVRFDLSLAYSNNQYIKNARFVKSRPFFKSRNFRFKNRLLHYLNMRGERKLLLGKDYDVFHPTYFNPYFLEYLGNKPFVLTIYDMVYELFPQIFSHRDKTGAYKKLLAPKATKIIAISENTKRDIIKLFGIKEDKIEVIYLANSLAAGTMEKGKGAVNDLPQKYLLFVGNRRGYKNFDTFVESISSLLQDDNGLHLVCAGGGKFTPSEIAGLEKLGIMQKVTQRHFDDNKLAQFYRNALALVFPSLYEGFGIPILEAFSCGCPVIASNISSLPEVAGNAAEYFDPADTMSILSMVKKVIFNDNLRQELKDRGYERLKEFSWGKTAANTKKLYQSIL